MELQTKEREIQILGKTSMEFLIQLTAS